MQREEVWAEIDGFPDYAVSSLGNVKSLRYDRLLGHRPNSYGQHRVALYRDGQRYDVYIHHLVAAAFTTGFAPGVRVKHHDADKGNNDVYNLRFAKGKGLGQLIKTPPKAKYRRVKIVENGLIFRTIEDCARYLGGDSSSIYRVLRGERDTHKGYTFEWMETTDE